MIKKAIYQADKIDVDASGAIKLESNKDEKHFMLDKNQMIQREADQAQKILQATRKRFSQERKKFDNSRNYLQEYRRDSGKSSNEIDQPVKEATEKKIDCKP